MTNIVKTNNPNLRLAAMSVGVLSTLRVSLPLVPADATNVEIIVTAGTTHNAYTAAYDSTENVWVCDIAASQFPETGKQKYEVAYKLGGKQFWDGAGWITIDAATTSGLTPVPLPQPARYVVLTVNGYGATEADGAVRIPKLNIGTEDPASTNGYIEGDQYFNRTSGEQWVLCSMTGTLTWVKLTVGGSVLDDVNADDIDSMTVRQRTVVLKKVVQALKGGALALAVMLCGGAFAAGITTSLLGDLTDDSSVVTDVTGIDTIESAVSAWSRYWGGDDFVVTITNYPTEKGANRSPSGKIPRLSMSWKTQDADGTNYQQVVWNECWWQDYLLGEYLPTNYYNKAQINAELNNKADRAWGFYDSHTGLYSPDGFTQVSSSNILLSAGMSYQQTITTEGSIWILTAHDGVIQTGVDSAGSFKISDAEGKAVFEIVKGDKRTVGAQAGSVTTLAGFSPTKLQVVYNVDSGEHPTLYVATNLSNPVWKSETDADCPALVVWSGASGAWIATIQGKAPVAPKMFAKATYEIGGETYIKNSAPVAITRMIIGGKYYSVTTATISGVLTLKLTPEN